MKENVSLGVGNLVKRNEALLGKWLLDSKKKGIVSSMLSLEENRG